MKSALKKIVPASVRDQYRERWNRLQRIFVRPPFPKNENGAVYVHLGCGVINHPKFINVDAIRLKHVHYICTAERLPMFQDNSVDLLYTSHCLEHISHLETPAVLREWRRVLKPGGILRISVPDFEKILRIYEANDRRIDAIELPLLGGQDYEFNFHKSAFNKWHLENLLLKAGFKNVREWEYGSSELTSLPDWSGKCIDVFGKRYPISLNMEAEKAV